MKNWNLLFFASILMVSACNLESYMPTEVKLKNTYELNVKKVLNANKEVLPEEITLMALKNSVTDNGQSTTYNSLVAAGYQKNLGTLDTAKANAACLELAKVILENVENDTSYTQLVINMQKSEKTVFTEKEWNYSRTFDCSKLREPDSSNLAD